MDAVICMRIKISMIPCKRMGSFSLRIKGRQPTVACKREGSFSLRIKGRQPTVACKREGSYKGTVGSL